MGGPAYYEAGQEEDLKRAQKVLATPDQVSLPEPAATESLTELVADILTRNNPATATPVAPGLRQVPHVPPATGEAAEPENPDLFLSYASVRRTTVLPIRNALVGLGYSVFFDIESLNAGEEFADVIDSRLKAAKAVIACYSHESFKSRWCKSEWRVGLHKGNLVPLAIDTIEFVEIPTEFNGLHYSDFSGYSGSTAEPCFRELLRAIRRHVRI
jgi:hypothetical protein